MTRNALSLFIVAFFGGAGILSTLPAQADEKPRLLVLTDIGGDPDDQQSMVRLMVYSNEFEIEGLIASFSVKPHLIREIVEAYGEVRDNLAQHADGYPTVEHLRMRIQSGNLQRGLAAIGHGHDTEGSRWIISVVDRPDSRPVDITIWGGQTDLAQTLWRVRADRGAAGLDKFKEGDTPAWFYFLSSGLSDSECPTWGGWGGRFTKTKGRLYRDAHDTVGSVTDARSTVWRWRDAFQRDFQTRMDWCVKPRSEANHHPVAVCNDDTSKAILRLRAKSGGTVKLSAAGSSDPDGHKLACRWWYYPEADTCRKNVVVEGSGSREARVMIPDNVSDSEIHVILEVTDKGVPSLTSYRRVVITVN
jgi:hypothetical protein